MTRIITSALIGAVLLMAWNFASWMILGFHDESLREIGGPEAPLLELLRESDLQSGAYAFPYMRMDDSGDPQVAEAAFEAFAERHRAGPTGMLFYQAEGSEPMPPTMFAIGFGIYFAGAFLVACLLSAASAGVRRYAGRVIFVATIGLVIAILGDLSNWNWARFPMDYTVSMVIDRAAGWFLVGLFMAAIVRKKTIELTVEKA